MPAIQVTPAGDQLYEVELSDPRGASQHTVSVPDHLVERLASDDSSMQDVVVAAMEFLTAREERDQLDAEIELAAVAARYDGFDQQVADRARDLARQPAAPALDDDGAPDRPSGDDRLLAEVREEQRTGEASSTGHRH